MERNVSIILLIAANLVPIFGVLVWGWDVFAILFLFWCENVVIGIFGIARTAIFSKRQIGPSGVFLAAFFTVHYGGFMFGHLMVLIGLFADGADPETTIRATLDFWTWVAIGGLFISHAWSFFDNYLGNREYESLSSLGAMAMPYKRMMITHIALLAGGFFLIEMDQPLAGLLILVGMKIALDVTFHRREHRIGAL